MTSIRIPHCARQLPFSIRTDEQWRIRESGWSGRVWEACGDAKDKAMCITTGCIYPGAGAVVVAEILPLLEVDPSEAIKACREIQPDKKGMMICSPNDGAVGVIILWRSGQRTVLMEFIAANADLFPQILYALESHYDRPED